MHDEKKRGIYYKCYLGNLCIKLSIFQILTTQFKILGMLKDESYAGFDSKLYDIAIDSFDLGGKNYRIQT